MPKWQMALRLVIRDLKGKREVMTTTDSAMDFDESLFKDIEAQLQEEAKRKYRITHHYDIGDQDVYVEHPTGEVDGKRVALYCWFKAAEWFGDSALVSNLGIASLMVAFYGFRHCAVTISTTVDLYSDAESFKGYKELMAEETLSHEGLRAAMAPHVSGC